MPYLWPIPRIYGLVCNLKGYCIKIFAQWCTDSMIQHAWQADLTLWSSSVSSSLLRWSTAISISESSSKPEAQSVCSHHWYIKDYCCLLHLTCLLCQWGEDRRRCDLQAGVSLWQGWERHGAQRLTESYEHALFWGNTQKQTDQVKSELCEEKQTLSLAIFILKHCIDPFGSIVGLDSWT